MSTIHITSKTGVRFCARILTEGDSYGRSGALAWEPEDRPGVEFYDTRYPHTEFGQFVGRYYVETILEQKGHVGLNLDCGIPDWSIDADAMAIVRRWLAEETAEPKLHAHFSTTSTDCDGRIDRDYVLVMTDEERASEFGDIEFHDRIVASVVNSYSLDGEARLTVTRLPGEHKEVRLVWEEPTEEGFRHTEVTICSDRCDEAETSYRDHRAESMGY